MTASEDALAILDDYDFELPESAIAQTALPERDAARLLLLDRENYEKLAFQHPQAALLLTQQLAAIISQRLRNMMGKLSELSEGFGIR